MKTICSMCGKEMPHDKNKQEKTACKECLDLVRKKIGLSSGKRVPIKTIERVIARMS